MGTLFVVYLIRGKAGNLGGRGRERRRGRGGREARAVVDVPLVGAPQAADAGGQLLWPEDSVGDVEERVGRRCGGGGDGAAPGATLRSEIGRADLTLDNTIFDNTATPRNPAPTIGEVRFSNSYFVR